MKRISLRQADVEVYQAVERRVLYICVPFWLAQVLESEVQLTKGGCTRLLGPYAMAEDKAETRIRLDIF